MDRLAIKDILNSVGAAIMILEVQGDGQLAYYFLNNAAEHYFGISDVASAGKMLTQYQGSDALRRKRRQRTLQSYHECIQAKTTVLLDIEHVRSDGQTKWGRHTIAPIFSASGEVYQLMVTSLDVTEQIVAEHRLETALTQTLSGFITICVECKDIKSEDGWLTIERYAAQKLNYNTFSHGLCPTCLQVHLAEL